MIQIVLYYVCLNISREHTQEYQAYPVDHIFFKQKIGLWMFSRLCCALTRHSLKRLIHFTFTEEATPLEKIQNFWKSLLFLNLKV